ncbi:BDH1, partial [Symbiodinium microadriaticum]
MLSFLIDALAGILAVVILVLNGISYCFERYFYKKVSIQPEKLAVVVTGCDSGFGEMISIKLASMGFHVISGCLTQEGVDRMSSIVKLSLICDVTNETDVAKLADSTEAYCKKKKCKVWAIVNNAGIADGGALDWTGIHVWRRVMEVNFFGVVIVTRAFLPLLKRCPESRVINLSSMAGLLAGANIGPYFASKHAVEGMAKALREELRPWGIHVSNLNPAFMKTPILLNGLEAAKRSFESAPENITSQYDQSFIQYHADMMTNTAE